MRYVGVVRSGSLTAVPCGSAGNLHRGRSPSRSPSGQWIAKRQGGSRSPLTRKGFEESEPEPIGLEVIAGLGRAHESATPKRIELDRTTGARRLDRSR